MDFPNARRYAKGIFSDGLYYPGKLFTNFLSNERGQASGTAIGVVILLAVLMIGALIFVKMYTITDQEISNANDNAATQAMTNIKSTGWSSFNMLVIAAFVAAAVVILAILMRLSGGGGAV